METEKTPQIENLDKIKAYIARDPKGVCRIYCQRGRRKWWRELGDHRATDVAFERALAVGEVEFQPKVKKIGEIFEN